MSNPGPYDDSFTLGPVPGGDVLFEPPSHVGQETQNPSSIGVPPEYQEHTYTPPPRVEPEARPAEWGPSRVNIPPVAGPDPRPRHPITGMRRNDRLTPWTPSRGTKKKVPPFFVVLGLIVLLGHLITGISGLFQAPDSAPSSTSSSVGELGQELPARVVEGMRLEPSPELGTRSAIWWRIEPPADGQGRTYTVLHDGQLVRQFSTAGQVVTNESFAPGRWSISFPNDGNTWCLVSVDSAVVARLSEPGPGTAECVLDTSWLPQQ